jgi:hypothetical protein
LIENIGLEKYIERINNIKIAIKNAGFNKYSKISMELFTELEKILNDKCYYGKNEKIVQFYDSDNKYFCFYVDFTYKNKIIEFYGDAIHGNPLIYSAKLKIQSWVLYISLLIVSNDTNSFNPN